MENEQHVIAQVKAGNVQAFQLLVEHYSHKLYCSAYRILGDREHAEDCVQEVFVKIYNKIDTFGGQSKFSTWLYSVTMFTAIDMERKLAKHGKNNDEGLDQVAAVSADCPEASTWRDRLGTTTHNALMQLNDDTRTAFLMRHHDGCSIEEISQVLELNPNTVKNRIFRAVARLRELLQPKLTDDEQRLRS